MDAKIARLLAAILGAAVLLGVAAWIPLGHGGAAFARLSPAAPRAERPAWPPWAHGQQAKVTTPADPTPIVGALTAPQRSEQSPIGESAVTQHWSGVAGSSHLREQRLWLAVAPLQGVLGSVPTPPPRFA
ncbi:MAG TPA: hypothetical protein VH916_14140 [Dehalococcoidia bacterium]|jgi:hypothetical protein